MTTATQNQKDQPSTEKTGRNISLNRSNLLRFSLHGFHHKLCKDEYYHRIRDSCKCKYCGNLCHRFHAKDCKPCTDPEV